MPTSRTPRREIDKERTRGAILDAAARLFAARGPEAVTFADLAKEAGISRTLIYFHFKNRDQLFHEVVVRANQMLHARFVGALSDRATGLDQMLAIGRAYQSFFEENPREFALMSCYDAQPADASRLSATEEQIVYHQNAVMELMTTVLRRGQKDGSVRRNLGDPLLTALCLWAFSHGMLQIASTMACGLEQSHGVKPAQLIDFGFELLRASLKRTKRS